MVFVCQMVVVFHLPSHPLLAINLHRSFRAFDSCKVVANIMSSLNLVEHVVDTFNNGVDVLRAGFNPESAFSAMHGLLGALNQTSSGCNGDPKKRTFTFISSVHDAGLWDSGL